MDVQSKLYTLDLPILRNKIIIFRSIEDENENLRADKEHLHREIKNLRNELDELVYEDNQRNQAYDELRDENNVLRLTNEEITSKINQIVRENNELKERLDSLSLKEEAYKHKIKCIETHSTGCEESVQRMQIKVERLEEREKLLEQEILGHVKNESEKEQEGALMNHTIETLKRNNETCNEQRALLQQEIKSLQLQIRDHEEQNADQKTETELRSQITDLGEQLEESERKRFETQNDLFTLKRNLTENNSQSQSKRMNNSQSVIDCNNTMSSIMYHKRFNIDHSIDEQAITTCDRKSLYKDVDVDGGISTRNDNGLVEDLKDQRNRYNYLKVFILRKIKYN